jgi:hypothetical protein
MDEAEWLACADPQEMLMFLRDSGRGSDRKFRLLACACCRWVIPQMPEAWAAGLPAEARWALLLPDERSRRAVDVAEQYADGAATRTAFGVLPGGRIADIAEDICINTFGRAAIWATKRRFHEARGAGWAEWGSPYAYPAVTQAEWDAALAISRLPYYAAACDLLRHFFGNPFRPITLDPAWLTWRDGLVVRLAQAAYQERHLPGGTLDNARLAVLADALEEAGCQDVQILGHLRGGGEHYRGCHILDALLGKE